MLPDWRSGLSGAHGPGRVGLVPNALMRARRSRTTKRDARVTENARVSGQPKQQLRSNRGMAANKVTKSLLHASDMASSQLDQPPHSLTRTRTPLYDHTSRLRSAPLHARLYATERATVTCRLLAPYNTARTRCHPASPQMKQKRHSAVYIQKRTMIHDTLPY